MEGILAYDSYDEEESFRDIPTEAASILTLNSSPSHVPLPERLCLTEGERRAILACGGVYTQLAKGKRVSLWQRHTSITKIRHHDSNSNVLADSSGSSSSSSQKSEGKGSHTKRSRNRDYKTPNKSELQPKVVASPEEQLAISLHSVIRPLFDSFSADQDTQCMLVGSGADGNEIVPTSAMDDWSNHRMRRSLRDLDEGGCDIACPYPYVSSDEDASPRSYCRVEVTPNRGHRSVTSVVSEALSVRRDTMLSMKGRVLLESPNGRGESPMGRAATLSSSLLQRETSLLMISKSMSQQRTYQMDSMEPKCCNDSSSNESRNSLAWSNLLKRCGATQKQVAADVTAVNSLASTIAIYYSSSESGSAGNSQSSQEEECTLQRAVDSLLS